uniref:Uncharacterized protein n=2 Tax=Aegilops tauschii subsp. strangulata TaxID=200361 RepID=A0A453DV75_AEGTS
MEFLWHTLILVIRIKHRWKTMDLIMDELEDTRISNPCIHQSHSYPVCHISNFGCSSLVNSPSKYFVLLESTKIFGESKVNVNKILPVCLHAHDQYLHFPL